MEFQESCGGNLNYRVPVLCHFCLSVALIGCQWLSPAVSSSAVQLVGKNPTSPRRACVIIRRKFKRSQFECRFETPRPCRSPHFALVRAIFKNYKFFRVCHSSLAHYFFLRLKQPIMAHRWC